MKKTLSAGLLLAAFLAALPALAEWKLDPERSSVEFISIKAKDVAEVHTFQDIQGTIGEDGGVSIALMLDSVETLIPIRNERMREFLFETTNYKEATLTAKIEPEILAGMKAGDIKSVTAEGNLSLHGATQPMTLSMRAARVSEGEVLVASVKPLIVNAEKFGLGSGIEKLREIAGLDSISHAVPVTFVITFVKAGG
jgi:polyisoprenoid-binding protein YceI